MSSLRLAPHALPDPFAVAILIVTISVLFLWRVDTLRSMLAGAVLGIVRGHLTSLRCSRSAASSRLLAKG
jgi:hypothetical protein